MTVPLLGPADPPPFETLNEQGASRALVVCDHASCRIPAALGTLGVSEVERTEHIGWDLGAGNVARRLSALLDAPAVLAGYSRLVVDCNRPAAAPDRIPAVSDTVPVPGNTGLDRASVNARIAEIFTPYHDAIAAALDRLTASGVIPVLVAVHSFTPQLVNGAPRPWQIGICWDKDRRMADPLIELLRADGLAVGANEPYDFGVLTDYTLPVHAEGRGLPSLLIEIRNSEIRSADTVETWAVRLACHIRRLLERPESQRLERLGG
ncbi:MAG: N-formylglutamate amidohydrolase [Rhodospirillales bacterium]|nr:N-formylglutamate amidohydrolase [Rhodospirillales bacterium]